MQRINPRPVGLLAGVLALAPFAPPQTPSVAVAPPPSGSSHASVANQICRHYADLQKAQGADLMYDQCMYARGYLVPEFSPSPDTPGYQGPLLGPATIGVEISNRYIAFVFP
jgi:hypothetical protein